MGIESDQLVFDYLSRIGDLAHGTRLTAAERARLVREVRADIERRRAEAGGAHTAAGTRKVLDRIGRPEEVVAAAAGADVPLPRESEPVGGKGGRRGRGSGPGVAPASTAASPPHLAGVDELDRDVRDAWDARDVRGGAGPDRWDAGPPPGSYVEGGELSVGGFVGGIELPEVLQPPPVGQRSGDGGAVDVPEEAPGGAAGGAPARLLRPERAAAGGPRAGGAVELLAAALLVAGAVAGSAAVLLLGWLGAYWSPRLGRREAKRAAVGVPGAVAGAVAVWLWGRLNGHWGERVAEGRVSEVLAGVWPWALRAAAVACALYLVWCARRRPQG